ncbi:MAG: hypothetical protein P3X23_000155 [Thermosynechococcus sp. Uc]|uniref:hypothetical protein n=1 Tax=Thermosynechococcus sp. Uc TaxID=3034853 RepID=UPI00259E1BA4|nr:hypothetical protein [Thermosynechococcus sp. Uc]MDM7325518.1 hypothetical protein [Thermosynechococcus sp. Uc]
MSLSLLPVLLTAGLAGQISHFLDERKVGVILANRRQAPRGESCCSMCGLDRSATGDEVGLIPKQRLPIELVHPQPATQDRLQQVLPTLG